MLMMMKMMQATHGLCSVTITSRFKPNQGKTVWVVSTDPKQAAA